MGTEYRLDLHTAAGVAQSTLTGGGTGGFRTLAYSKRVDEGGRLVFQLDGDNAAIATLEHKGIVEVWRRNAEEGIAWYNDFTGLYLDQERRYTDAGQFVATCLHPLWLLGTRRILYYAGSLNLSKFTNDPAETIMKTLVEYNAGASATVGNGRLRTPGTLNITCAADTAAGGVVDWYCAWDNLLSSLQALSLIGGGDYDLVENGAGAWEFRWYTGQLGTDRSASVLFSLELGNMRNPVYRRTRSTEATVALVAGQDEGADRKTRIRTGADYAVANDIETYINAATATTDAALDAQGDKALRDLQAEHEFTFEVIQGGSKLYGRDYFMGDLVKAKYDTIEVTRKVVGVSVEWLQDGTENVMPEMGQV